MLLRIQTVGEISAVEALRKGMEGTPNRLVIVSYNNSGFTQAKSFFTLDLKAMCDITRKKFEKACATFQSKTYNNYLLK